jgi:MbtH protein
MNRRFSFFQTGIRGASQRWSVLLPILLERGRLMLDEAYSIFDDEAAIFTVVVNHEEQYSIWPEDHAIPAGWRMVGKKGTKAECVAYIDEAWTDMRPLSPRKVAEEISKEGDLSALPGEPK